MARMDFGGGGSRRHFEDEPFRRANIEVGGTHRVSLDPDMVHVFFGQVEEFVPDPRGQAAVYKILLEKLAEAGKLPKFNRVEIPYQVADTVTSQEIASGLILPEQVWFEGMQDISTETRNGFIGHVNEAMGESVQESLEASWIAGEEPAK